ncbi:MAG: hypothetical protein WC254_02640 [Candidatus Woesearchaeota archaeon]|jgi:hypothetical protein
MLHEESETGSVDFYSFKENVDSWIKDFNSQVCTIQTMSETVAETVDNTNHNYEMLQEMKKQMDALQQEVKTMKLMQLLAIKKAIEEDK